MARTKTRSKRKSRTEDVSSPSSSEGESMASPPLQARPQNEMQTSAADSDKALSDEPIFDKRVTNPEQAFEDFYLQQATKEFGNDLEKLRNANDFRAGSVDLLIRSLKQGAACFSKDERMKIGGAASAAS